MGWRDNLRRVTLPDGRKLIGGSFRGVTFFVESHDRSGGRRNVNDELPFRDPNFIEDLGRKARVFTIDAYVLGEDYQDQADKLISALEDKDTPGQLVHPRYGLRTCVCDDFTVHETNSEGGRARVAIKFLEAPAQAIAPTVEADPQDELNQSADAAETASDTEFQATYDVAGMPGFAVKSAETAIRSASQALGAALGPVVATTDELAKLSSDIEILTDSATALARAPSSIFSSFKDAIAGLVTTVAASPLKVIGAFLATYDVDMGTAAPTTTATRQRERTNQIAIQGALRQLMIAEAARLAPRVTYESIDEANATRDAITGRLDEQAGLAGDTAYPGLVDLRSAVERTVPGDHVFARVITVTRPAAIPALLLSYELYGSVDQEQDIIDRNDVRHPGFVAGDLLALSNG